jgi:prenyltransferase beta subunit
LAVILSLQQPSGVFAGDAFGEIDNRFLYSAVNALSLLGRLHELDVDKTVGYIQRCKNFDGGFGAVIGAESHAAMGKSKSKSLRNVGCSLYWFEQCSFALQRWLYWTGSTWSITKR